jgi:hypothetical protein
LSSYTAIGFSGFPSTESPSIISPLAERIKGKKLPSELKFHALISGEAEMRRQANLPLQSALAAGAECRLAIASADPFSRFFVENSRF